MSFWAVPADIQRAAAALPAAHGQDHGLGLEFQNAFPALGGDDLIRSDRSDGGFVMDLDAALQHLLLVHGGVFRAGQLLAQLVQAETIVNALAQNAAKLRLRRQ